MYGGLARHGREMDFTAGQSEDHCTEAAMTTKSVILHAPSAAPEVALTAFVLAVLVASAALLLCWIGVGA